MSTYTDQILDAVDILVNEKVSTLQFDQTVRATIKEVVDASIGKYKVSYQNSLLYAYSLNIDNTYSAGTQVYIEIPSSDFNKDIIIVGPVSKLGINYVTAIAPEDKVGIIENNLINNTDTIAFCSFKESESYSISGISDASIYSLYKDKCDTLVLAANFRTALPPEQQIGGGNYGLKVKCTYVNSAYKTPGDDDTIIREYVFNVDNMEGQPYKYTLGSRQVALFPIDGANLKSIDSIEAFCENFPNTIKEDEEKDNDIFISDIELYLGALYTEEELSGSSLRIIYPDGNIIGNQNSLKLKANLRIKGKAVNVQEQGIGFYWFKKDNSITSSSKLYSPYGGVGWSCLNPVEEIDGRNLFYIDAEVKTILEDVLTSYKNIFKCVAIYNDNGQEVVLSAQGELYNTENQEVIIKSSTGTNFSFNIGQTTLECIYKEEEKVPYSYYWTQKIDSGVEEPCGGNGREINVNIGIAAHIAEYSCTVWELSKDNETDEIKKIKNCGTGFITLVNESETKHGYTLIINNGTKVFKYDEYGVSPTSVSKAPSDRMVLETLTFDIYNELGQKINLTDEEKIRACKIKWVFPKNNTLLTTAENLINDNLINVTTNTSEKRKILQKKATFTYGIENWYNEWKKNNNIQLEIDYLDQHLVASTNFTFTKEGELGTNGTKYVARIVPVAGYDEIILKRKNEKGSPYYFYGIKFNPDKENGESVFNEIGTSASIRSRLFDVQLWDGQNNIVSSAANIKWSLASTTIRAGSDQQRLTINENNGIINIVQDPDQTNYQEPGQTNCNVIQATITYDNKKFYATYSIPLSTSTATDIPWLQNGYKEVMYESDGTRGKFNGLPFTAKLLSDSGLSDPTSTITFGVSGGAGFGSPKKINKYSYSIEPPSYFISETYGHYVSLKIGSYTTYFPIQLYLNRYGMAAMNDWDGTSIEIKKDSGSYILAPQIGAGTKNDSNQFTGITMGEVFQVDNNNKQTKQVGLFGYGNGEQTLFLDAQTGNATFGRSGNGQIKIKANGEGTIESGDYSTTNKKGLKINFSSNEVDNQQGPFIKYGSGNFEVNASGHITAKGGGSIAGWQIADKNLYKINEDQNGKKTSSIYLNSSTPKIYGQINDSKQHSTLTSSNEGFYLASDGLSIGSKFKVSSDGTIRVGKNAYDNNYAYNWEINGSDSENNSYIKYGTKGNNNSVYLGTDEISLGKTFKVDNQGVLTSTSGHIGGWTIEAYKLSSDKLTLNSTPVSAQYPNPQRINANNVFVVYNDGSFRAANDNFSVTSNGYITSTSGKIGGWTIGENTLTSGNLTLNSSGTANKSERINANSKFIVYNDGSFSAANGDFSVTSSGSITAKAGTIGGWNISDTTLSNHNITLNAGTTKIGNETQVRRITAGSDGKFIVWDDGSIKSTSGVIGGWVIGNNDLYDSDEKIYLDSNTPKIYGQSDKSKKHNTLTSSSNGFYLASDGLSIGSKFKVENNGVMKIGTNAVANSNLCWTVDGTSARSYIAYGATDYVPEIKSDSTDIGGVSGSVYLGTEGIRLGTKFGVDNKGNAKLNNLYANGSGQIGGWTIGENTLSSGNFSLKSSGNNDNSERININSGKFIAYNDGRIKATAGTIGGWDIEENSLKSFTNVNGGSALTLNAAGEILGPIDVAGQSGRRWWIESNGIAHFKNVIIDNQGGNSGGSSLSWTNPDDGYTAFSVDKKGNLYARLANIAGNVEANSGHIGDVSITGGGIGGSSWSINNSGMNFGNMFYVDTSGYVTASNINATGGSIGGCAISNGQLQVGAANIGSCNANALKINGNDISLTPVTIPSFGRAGVFGIVHYTDISVPTTVTINGNSATLGGFQSYHVVEYIDTMVDGYPLSVIYDYGTYPPAGTTYYVMAQ